jgi:DNA-binding XRE family transcriptional regulator
VNQETGMAKHKARGIRYQVLDLNGVRYAVVKEMTLRQLCKKAGAVLLDAEAGQASPQAGLSALDIDDHILARRLVERRKRVGLTQAELARRAGIRVETLNRVERARTTPDFATVRKLVLAMKKAEANLQSRALQDAATL